MAFKDMLWQIGVGHGGSQLITRQKKQLSYRQQTDLFLLHKHHLNSEMLDNRVVLAINPTPLCCFLFILAVSIKFLSLLILV